MLETRAPSTRSFSWPVLLELSKVKLVQGMPLDLHLLKVKNQNAVGIHHAHSSCRAKNSAATRSTFVIFSSQGVQCSPGLNTPASFGQVSLTKLHMSAGSESQPRLLVVCPCEAKHSGSWLHGSLNGRRQSIVAWMAPRLDAYHTQYIQHVRHV